MLLYYSSDGLDMNQLLHVYRESIEHERDFSFSNGSVAQRIQDFESFWHYEFFSVPGAVCAVLDQDGNYASVLRLEPYRDGLLITGLVTAPEHRRKGMATRLLGQVIQHLKVSGGGRLYSHIERRNKPSVCVHKSCGFYLLTDHAIFLDGSVSQNYDTYGLDI